MNNLKASNQASLLSIPTMDASPIFHGISFQQHLKFIMIIFIQLMYFSTFAQSQHFYGHIPDQTYSPTDIIQLESGNLIIIGESSHVESSDVYWHFNQYIVEINRQGDTIWTSNVPHGWWRFSNVIEKTNNDGIVVWGTISNDDLCNGYTYNWGFKHYYVRLYDKSGLHLNTTTFADACDTEIVKFFKDENSIGGLTRINQPGSSKKLYSIKLIDREGNLKHIDISLDDNFMSILKLDSGFLIFNPLSQTLNRLDEDGNIIWEKITPYTFSASIYKVEDNNLLFKTSGNYIIKTDSLGNEIWNKTVQISVKHILKHSSGNYLLTGIRDGHLAIEAISPDGDSISLRHYMEAKSSGSIIRTIELNDGSIATLTNNLTRITQDTFPDQYVLTFDTLDLPLVNATIPSDNLFTDLILFPNPAKDYFTIQTSDIYNNLQLLCYNSLGQLIATHQLLGSNSTISTVGWHSGPYFLKVIDAQGMIIYSGKVSIDH